MHIRTDGIPKEELILKAAFCEISPMKDDGSFIVTPSRRIPTLLKVYRVQKQDTSLVYEYRFSVKNLPMPRAIIGGGKTELSRTEFLAQHGISVDLINYDYDLRTPVESFTIMVLKEGKLLFLEDKKGARFDYELKAKLAKYVRGGERILVTNIKFKSPFHEHRIANSIEIQIKK